MSWVGYRPGREVTRQGSNRGREVSQRLGSITLGLHDAAGIKANGMADIEGIRTHIVIWAWASGFCG